MVIKYFAFIFAMNDYSKLNSQYQTAVPCQFVALLLIQNGISPAHAKLLRVMKDFQFGWGKRILSDGIVKYRFKHIVNDFLIAE